MPKYVLVNRRAGMFTDQAKLASRASIASALSLVPNNAILDDRVPKDKLARRVAVLDLDEAEATRLASEVSSDVVLEPLIIRKLHHRRPAELRNATLAVPAAAAAGAAQYQVTIAAGGGRLGDIEVMFYVADPFGTIKTVTTRTSPNGQASIALRPGERVAFVEPIPYAGFWIMLAEAPPTGSTVDCTPVKPAPAGGKAWWHAVTNTGGKTDGKDINVGVIDTGCGPHPNLHHVTLVGAFVDGGSLPAAQAVDVAEHGTHTSGIIGARPSKAGDYTGMAPACNLFHARVFKGEGEHDGPSQADLITAIDTLSRDHHCDLINMSLGGGPQSKAEEDCIRDALERGTLCICSAGNDSGPVNFPGAYPECVSVSALGQVGWAPPGTFSAGNRPREPGKMGRDNLFLATFSSNGNGLDATGPGVGIVSTVPNRAGATGLYMEMDGTSMASPAVCATLAALLSKDSAYAALPRDTSRSTAARRLLEANCVSVGLAATLQGFGLPVVGDSNAPVPSAVAARSTPMPKPKARA
ncbi:S8 family serine peptidase [Bradyrhizobium liaoningense]|uniref:S8 family peptidase n=1 Tax=Bradyrhizobium liaoningense TaxID=43992 RepID=UPI001BA6694A|nr:S8 family serine peptidase [Bradyrhizobium liaoningense]MBR0719204.1 S8 family serine peptidase [Bradyrhizobium liaoningense]